MIHVAKTFLRTILEKEPAAAIYLVFFTVPRKNWKKCVSASRIHIRRGKHDDDDDDGMKSSLSQAI